MNAEHLPLARRERLEELQVREPQGAVERERITDVTRAVPARMCPHILIESLDVRAGRRKNQAYAIGADELVIREVRDDFANRPFPRRGPLREVFLGETINERGQNIRSFALEHEWIGAILISKDSRFVLIDRFDHTLQLNLLVNDDRSGVRSANRNPRGNIEYA